MPIKSDPRTWRDRRQRLGLAGERAAVRHLEAQGFEVVDHRFRMGRLEIDLVARRGRLVAFIEVKTRGSRRYGSPLEAVNWSKRQDIARVAQAWADRHGRPDDTYRFDAIGVVLGRGAPRIQHVEDAFRLART